ncbi:MAG: HAMP domain-containing sensor histidine kinase [Thermoanaerobaculum sp.]|nr:HAMP domain-containing sensor histidine kinase [Thermoanaerobaculum sp.]
MTGLPVRRFREVRALFLAVMVFLVLGLFLALLGVYLAAAAPAEEPDTLWATAAAVAAGLQQGGAPVAPFGQIRLALFSGGRKLWTVGTTPPVAYWPFANKQAWEEAGRPTLVRGEWAGEPLQVVVWPLDGDRVLQVFGPVKKRAGSPSWLRLTVALALVLGLAGGGLAYVLVGRVLAPYGELMEEARKFAGRQQQGAEDRFLVSAFRQAVRRVEQQERQLSARAQELAELAAGLAHELRNNLAVMDGYLRLAKENPTEVGRYLHALGQELQVQREFLERFLAFARPQALQVLPVALGPLLAQLQGRLASCFPQVPVAVEGDARVLGDPTALRVVLENLLRNACEAAAQTPQGGVQVRVTSQGSQVEVQVVDHGPGVAPEVRESLFEPFVSQKPAGGIGLALARRLARDMGGEVELVSPANPTVFSLRLPQEGSW